jgi:hypothetical protein
MAQACTHIGSVGICRQHVAIRNRYTGRGDDKTIMHSTNWDGLDNKELASNNAATTSRINVQSGKKRAQDPSSLKQAFRHSLRSNHRI